MMSKNELSLGLKEIAQKSFEFDSKRGVKPTPETNERVIREAEKIRKIQLKNLQNASRAKTIWD